LPSTDSSARRSLAPPHQISTYKPANARN
jgi:hypothetical protein